MTKVLDPKLQLNDLIETEFKRYTENKVYVSDLATGGGKSHNIAKLTCNYYPKHFGQIVILCVQNKLIDGMADELSKFYDASDSLVKKDEVLIVESNANVLVKAIRSGKMRALCEELKRYVEKEKISGGNALNEIEKNIKKAEDTVNNSPNGLLDKIADNKDFAEIESKIRRDVKKFLSNVRGSKNKRATALKLFPSLPEVFPQINLKKAKVAIMTIHKALMGIDLILEKEISILGFDNSQGTLFIFDESDQAALSMRDVIVEQALREDIDLYRIFTTYQSLIEDTTISEEFPQRELLLGNMGKVRKKLEKRFMSKMGIKRMPNDILLDRKEDLESIRNGIFLCGPMCRYNIRYKDANQFRVTAKGTSHLEMVKDTRKGKKKKDLKFEDFVELLYNSTRTIKSSLTNVVKNIKKDQMDKYRESMEKTGSLYELYPTDENSIHTLASRFRNVDKKVERQLLDFLTTARNIRTSQGDSVEDASVYMQGMHLYNEQIDEQDILGCVSIHGHEVMTTPEKIIIQLISKPKNAVILSSATANGGSVASNFSIHHLKYVLCGKMSWIDKATHQKFEELSNSLYHEDHKVETLAMTGHKFSDSRVEKWELPEKYRNMFCKGAVEERLPDRWFKITKSILKRMYSDKSEKETVQNLQFQLNRLFKFIEVYWNFMSREDIHSLMYFQNKTGKDEYDRKQVMLLASLIDGSYKDSGVRLDSCDLPEISNKSILISNNTGEVKEKVRETVGRDPDAKLMLVTAYNSFKAGENLQYGYPDGLSVLEGNTWNDNKTKDWDAIYVEEPSHHFTIKREYSDDEEKQKYLSLLNLMMFYEDGMLSLKETYSYIDAIIKNQPILAGNAGKHALKKDKAKWMLTILEQSIGRLCRTKNKNRTTHIFYDEGIMEYFRYYDRKKSYTKEFRTLISDITESLDELDLEWEASEESERVNLAEKANADLNRINSKALWYILKDEDLYEEEEDWEEGSEAMAYRETLDVEKYQRVVDDFKRAILKNPTIQDPDNLESGNIGVNLFNCYGKWKRNPDREGYDYWRRDLKICTGDTKDSVLQRMSPEDVRLDCMMRNATIKAHFEKSGFATSWDKFHPYILHPDILQSWYAGEIGEQAFLALMSEMTDVKFVKLKGKLYELADFVVRDKNEKNLIAYDVKNFNPDLPHVDKAADMETPAKRRLKRERLKCRVVTVNILEIEGMENTTDEIGGLINKNGECLTRNIEIIKNQINSLLK